MEKMEETTKAARIQIPPPQGVELRFESCLFGGAMGENAEV